MEKIELWPDGAPEAKADQASDRPWLAVYRPAPGHASGAAVIVCPGGGYDILMASYEGLQVARELAGRGLTAFALMYRVTRGGYSREVAEMDGRRAMRLVRARAPEFGVDAQRIGILGFSAGGHLVSATSMKWDAGTADAADPIERVSSRPDFAVPVYGLPASLDDRKDPDAPVPVAADHPPTFLVHTAGDQMVPADLSVRYYRALRGAGVEAELHIFGGYGPHGYGLASGAAPGFGEWPMLLMEWLRRTGLLVSAQRVAVGGKVTLDGQPLVHGWLTLIPADSEFAPVAATLVTGDKGEFAIPAAGGPVPGRHRVEVRQTALHSVLEPELDREILLTKSAPSDPGPLTVDVVPGSNSFTLDFRTH